MIELHTVRCHGPLSIGVEDVWGEYFELDAGEEQICRPKRFRILGEGRTAYSCTPLSQQKEMR